MVAVLQCRHLGGKAKRGKGKMFRGKGKMFRGKGKMFRGKGFSDLLKKLRVTPSGKPGKKQSSYRPWTRQGKSGWSKYLGGSRAKVKC